MSQRTIREELRELYYKRLENTELTRFQKLVAKQSEVICSLR
jgi:hypothetical protein